MADHARAAGRVRRGDRQNKAEAAQKAGKFDDEIVAFTVKGRKGDTVVDKDEYIRHGATIDAMAKLRPAFAKDGTVTAGNASRPQRRRGGRAPDDRRERREARDRAAGADRLSYATAGLDP